MFFNSNSETCVYQNNYIAYLYIVQRYSRWIVLVSCDRQSPVFSRQVQLLTRHAISNCGRHVDSFSDVVGCVQEYALVRGRYNANLLEVSSTDVDDIVNGCVSCSMEMLHVSIELKTVQPLRYSAVYDLRLFFSKDHLPMRQQTKTPTDTFK